MFAWIKEGVKMPREMFQAVISLIIALFLFWLLYRIKNRIARLVRNKIIKDFPQITSTIEAFQQKINYLNSRLEFLECKINALENKIKNKP